MSDSGETTPIAETGRPRPEFRQFIEWAATGIGILTSGTAIWSAFTVLDATAESARARIFERQLDACLNVQETGTAYAAALADAKSLIDTRATMPGDIETFQTFFKDGRDRTDAATEEAQKAFFRNAREIQILYPKPVADLSIRLQVGSVGASAMTDVAWQTAAPDDVAGLAAHLRRVREGVAGLSEACAASLAATARLARE